MTQNNLEAGERAEEGPEHGKSAAGGRQELRGVRALGSRQQTRPICQSPDFPTENSALNWSLL